MNSYIQAPTPQMVTPQMAQTDMRTDRFISKRISIIFFIILLVHMHATSTETHCMNSKKKKFEKIIVHLHSSVCQNHIGFTFLEKAYTLEISIANAHIELCVLRISQVLPPSNYYFFFTIVTIF